MHVPLPQADYHNIRHHDAPNEVCLYHDHLLRWHPSAHSDDDVALLHWHWFLPLVDRDQRADDESQDAGSHARLHAQFGDWPEPDWRGEPVIRPDSRGRLLEQITLRLSVASSTCLSGQLSPLGVESGCFFSHDLSAADGARAARIALIQRWNC
jgi:hypothetical protein